MYVETKVSIARVICESPWTDDVLFLVHGFVVPDSADGVVLLMEFVRG